MVLVEVVVRSSRFKGTWRFLVLEDTALMVEPPMLRF